MKRSLLCACAFFLASAPAGAQVAFVENAAGFGIGGFRSSMGMGNGVAAADFEDDGDIDVFVPNAAGAPDQFYRNLGHGRLEEVARRFGLASVQNSRVALWFDYNGDNRLDLLVGADCFMSPGDCDKLQTLTLYAQTPRGFLVDVSTDAGLTNVLPLTEKQHLGGLAAGDLDRDGDLDFLVVEWAEARTLDDSRLFRNNGDGTFSDVTRGSGIDGTKDARWQPLMFDLTGDGYPDIFSAVDFGPNRLWTHQGDLWFVDSAPASGTDSAFNEMGAVLGDPDNDRDLDIYVTNVTKAAGFTPPFRHNVLFLNRTEARELYFDEVAVSAGVAETSWAWGATFLDADRDGWLDLAVTNGFTSPPHDRDRSAFFVNDRTIPLHFTERSDESGFNDTYWGSSLIAIDLDRDGDQDLVQTTVGGPLRVMENTTVNANHWLVVRPRSGGLNRRAIGATVRATAGGITMTRPITAGMSFMGQEPSEAFFGLGTAMIVDTVTVEWPDGSVTTMNNIAADQAITVAPGG